MIEMKDFGFDGENDKFPPVGKLVSDLIHTPCPQIKRGLRGKLLADYLEPLERKGFTPFQKSVLVGSLLGDGRITPAETPKKKALFKFDQGRINHQAKKEIDGKVDKEYVTLMYSIFHEFVGAPPKARFKDGKEIALEFSTYRSKLFDYYKDLFYEIDVLGNRRKCVPKNIHQLLKPEALAFWFADDGSCRGVLHTECFTFSENRVLQQALGTNFGLEVAIHKNISSLELGSANHPKKTLYRLYIAAASWPTFINIVSPFLPPSKRYKLFRHT